MKTKIQKWGNSLALRIPKAFASEAKIRQSTVVDVSLVDGKLVVKPFSAPRYTLEQLVQGIRKDNLHAEVDWGQPTGKEVW